jgi:hypothetical protein
VRGIKHGRNFTSAIALLFFLFSNGPKVQAKDMSSLYDTSELETWHFILEPQTRRNFEILISRGLDDNQKANGQAISLQLPLVGRYKDVLEYYAHDKTIVVPILSLKFLHDLLLANAWLYINGFDFRTIDQYVSKLKYNEATDFPFKRYPKPLPALGIPAEARLPPWPPDLETTYMSSATVASCFIMAHEIGHVVLGHTTNPATTLKGRLREEEDADAFALRALTHIRPDVADMSMFLSITSAWAPMITDFKSREAYEQFLTQETDHPITGERIRALGTQIRNNPRLFLWREEYRGAVRKSADLPTPENIARVQRRGEMIIKLGDQADDEEHQRNLAIHGIGTSLDSLKPRRLPTELLPRR